MRSAAGVTTGAMAMPGTEWTLEEPGGRRFIAEVRRLARRNRAHPAPLLLAVLCTTGLGLFLGYRYQPVYEARIAMRLTESDALSGARPRQAAELRSWVEDVALSDRHLIQVMDRFHLLEPQRKRGLDQALESLREDIDIEVWRNEFLDDDPGDLVGRSARVALSYRHADPEAAFGVVSALAEATVAEQRRMRKAQAEYLALGLEPSLEAARSELMRLRLSQVRGAREPVPPSPWPVPPGLTERQKDVEFWEKRIAELSAQREEALRRLRAETQDLGLQSEIIDSLHPVARPYRARAMSFGGAVGLVLGMLLFGVTLNAFDRHIYDEEDLRRLGYVVCGALPAYPGDDVGSMRSRVRMNVQ